MSPVGLFYECCRMSLLRLVCFRLISLLIYNIISTVKELHIQLLNDISFNVLRSDQLGSIMYYRLPLELTRYTLCSLPVKDGSNSIYSVSH